jgi:hypothetical protein
MNATTMEELKILLGQHRTNALAQRAQVALLDSTSDFYPSTGPLPIEHVRRIYRRRARLNANRENRVEGLDDLVNALTAESEGGVDIHGVARAEEVFSVFTDAAITRLLGVLVSRKATAHDDR